MAQQTRPCTVLIAGGGIAGLALAVMLEKHGIGYTLLEAYPEIVAPAGAGICMLPHGLRILDQLGCYEALVSKVQDVMEIMSYRDQKGEELVTLDGFTVKNVERHGYSTLWVGRRELLQVMYDCIRDKAKLLTKKRVESVRQLDNGIEVTTADGSVYRGDILVGTDGVHSQVRKEMVRHATEQGIAEDYAEEHKIPAKYECLFGASTAVPGIPRGYLAFGVNEGFSNVIGTGPKGRVYWFVTRKMDKTYFGSDTPKFTKGNEERFVREHWDDQITADVRFSDLYKAKQDVIHTPLREFVYRKWHLNRMIVLGDASHKMTPVLGQGGNQALETVAALTNSLMAALKRPNSNRLSMSEIDGIFTEVQELRSPRVEKMMVESHEQQCMHALETPELREVMLHQFPQMAADLVPTFWDATIAPAVSIKTLPVPKRERTVPFEDEIRAKL
ncbi:hypothetical protein BJX68DRAFT_185187 [Aspergillus pseudodeflectus]|uniref:FAD-binding domain-containing protein n=1 Tax=Aspergillus pseudodeflectus TaxID=176178 RepID=A0ABR4JKL9_9EURO